MSIVAVQEAFIVRILRYVHDFLIVYRPRGHHLELEFANKKAVMYTGFSEGMIFTFWLPTENFIEYLGAILEFRNNYVCWGYGPGKKKGLLLFASAHSKT